MTLPRKLLPGTTYMVARRVAQRVFLLRPEPLCNQTVEYCFGRALALYPDIELHALQVLSDHFHAVLTDAGQSLPLFMAWVDREIAKAMNKHLGMVTAQRASVRRLPAPATFRCSRLLWAQMIAVGGL